MLRAVAPILAVVALLWVSPTRSETLRRVAGDESAPDVGAKLSGPFGLGVLPDGSIVFVEMTGHRVKRLSRDGQVQTIAGTGKEGATGEGGPALRAEFRGMHAMVVEPGGDLLVADTWNNRVRRIDMKNRTVSTVIGTGERGFSGDGGRADAAKFGGIYSIALSSDNQTIYVCDLDNRRIRAVDRKTGIVHTVAGNGQKGVPEDGAPAVRSPLVDPRAIAVDSHDNLYILERNGNALRVVSPDGTIRTVAGTGKAGFSGDDGPALKATLNGPKDLTVDRDGSVLIADTENHVIRRYRPSDGKIVLVAGTGRKGDQGLGGDPRKAELAQPHGVAIDRDGPILISDSSNNRIVRIEP